MITRFLEDPKHIWQTHI